MPALVIGGITAKPMTWARLPDEKGGAGKRRTVNGHLRGTPTWVKRAWAADLVAVDDIELADLLAVIDTDANIAISGDLPGATYTCGIERSEVETVRELGGWFYTIPITLRQV